ncbi:vesicular glutamate transporter 3-like [Planococcus citri]|uniref:vesicular glutamate transporter 3-like n=1 Tax=Planococcus citri TaxID=170843 RepID=UPI0031F7BD0C
MNREADSNGLNSTSKKLLQEANERQGDEHVAFLFSKRFMVISLIFFGNASIVLFKVNVNIAIIEMTSNSTEHIVMGNLTTKEPEFDWDSKTIGVIQSAYAYGYLFCAAGIPMVNKLGGAVTFGISVLAMAITNLVTPACLQANFFLFLGSRILIGLLDGTAYMGTLEMLCRWAPVPERSSMMSLCCCGMFIGVVVSYPVCGFLATRWGWQSIFYISGLEGTIWSIIWLIFVKNQPSKDKWISKKELMYILQHTETTPRKQVVHPYKKIFSSSAVWALCVGKFTYSWGFTLLVVCFPLYVKDITGRNTDEIGLISSIPNVVCIFTIPLAGFIMDYWQNNSNLTVTQIHKIVMVTGFISGSIFFVIASFSSNFILSMSCFVLTEFIISFNYLILQLVCLYMSPTHSSILAGAYRRFGTQ